MLVPPERNLRDGASVIRLWLSGLSAPPREICFFAVGGITDGAIWPEIGCANRDTRL
jgi:hypothetical protein